MKKGKILKADFASLPSFENARACICTQCPVETPSQCSMKKKEQNKKIMETGTGPLKGPSGIPKLYCATGVAECKDLDTAQMCICGDCPVWKRYGLERADPSMYFCRDGRAR